MAHYAGIAAAGLFVSVGLIMSSLVQGIELGEEATSDDGARPVRRM